jgi:hypothetical protein
MAEFREFARPMVRRSTGLEANKTRRQALEKLITWLRRSCFRTTTFSSRSIP